MIYTIGDFVREFILIRDKGWIQTHRSGSTGVGKTLEDLLGIIENNDDGPDFGEYELKSARLNSNSMLTLFTKSPLPRGINSELREKYGYVSSAYSNERKVLHATLNSTRFVSIQNTGQSLKITCDEEKAYIESEAGSAGAYWTYKTLVSSFKRKYQNNLVYVKAASRGTGKKEEFHYLEAYELSGFDSSAMIKLLKEGKVYVDLRIGQYSDGRTHDHGTGFRIREIDQPLLFRVSERIA